MLIGLLRAQGGGPLETSCPLPPAKVSGLVSLIQHAFVLITSDKVGFDWEPSLWWSHGANRPALR